MTSETKDWLGVIAIAISAIGMWIMFTMCFAISLFAMQTYSLTALIHPVYAVVGNVGFFIMVFLRRRVVGRPSV